MLSATWISISVALLFAGQALGHGKLTSPSPRSDTIGSAFSAACGSQLLSTETSDPYGNIQQELQTSSVDSSTCNLWLCKGYQFADNEANVQSYTAGQTVSMTAEIRAPHTGIANVSIVATATNTIIGDALYSWDDYASNQSGVTADDEAWDIMIPSDLGDQCATAGDCVIQWYWYSESVDQTYEDCVDFTVGGSSDSSGSTSAASVSESATATSADATVSTTSIIAVPVNSSASSEDEASTSTTSVEASATTVNSVVVSTSVSSIVVASSTSGATTATATSAAEPSTVATSTSVTPSTVKTSGVATSTSASAASATTSTSTTNANECMNSTLLRSHIDTL
ncbi:uncharacterized protein EV420DRAFT_1633920 [Desarmillaria tabescens]|uniref:Chitin-binding type-4 domain-containing protein n=1 Tax=Armillaria tabescens TaxID=1929756 RepID=A0AA39NPM5_ARMTA|nr:uncharacterized protein EV420DRAFT_1633920 [Desarmillaria tabescens]KAK0469495.1 hypothetical protein EV420DRAFT_1633920 [Desarmillaria tabescens]